MRGARDRHAAVRRSIFADEIGLEYGIHGDYRLRSAYQPIFAPRGGTLVPVAVEALIQPQRDGQPVAPTPFLDALPARERLHVEALCRALHLRNFHFIGVEGLALFFNYDPQIDDRPGRALAEIRLMARRLADYGLDGGMLVCEVTEQAASDDATLRRVADEMRRNGIRIAIDDFGAGHSTEKRLRLLEPDIVKIDGAWFAEVCRHAAAERLFRPLLSLLHDRGAQVLVEGIEQEEHLRVALDGGADLLQGFLLARPALVGTLFPAEPLALDDLLKPRAKVIPLFG